MASAVLALAAPLPPPKLTLDDQIRNAASLVSLALALLTLFTNRRLSSFDDEIENIEAWSRGTVVQTTIDMALFGLTVVVIVAVAPLVVASWPPDIGRQDAVLRTLITVAALGLAAVAALQLWMIGYRATKASSSSRSDRRSRRERGL